MSFSEGRAVVTIGDKQGFIDTSGKLVISPRFYSCNKFENGIALVLEEITSKACFIDEKGEIKLQGKDFLVSKFKEELINCSENGK